MRRFLFVALLLVSGIAVAQIPKPKKQTFVNDYAGILTAGDIKSLNQKIYIIQKQAGVQLAIVLVDKVPSAYTIKSFANKIGSTWRVGKNKKGMVYVAAIQQHQQRLAVAKNLDTIFTDEKCNAILADMKTAFRNSDYNGGLTILVNKIHATLIGPPAPAGDAQPQADAAQPGNKPTQAPDTKDDTRNTIIGIAFVVLVVILIRMYFKNRSKRQMRAFDEWQRNQPNNGDPNNGGYPDGGGYPGGGRYSRGRRSSGLGSFVAGAALGAAGGYGARYLQDKMNEHGDNHPSGSSTPDNFTNTPITEDNNANNWGNWAGSSDDNNGFSDDSSSSSSYDSGSSDSGFSDSGSSGSDGGSTSDW